jgi:hypothetical protein
MNVQALTAAATRPATRAEIAYELTRPIGEEEREEVLALVRWFTRRYDAAGRLAYVRRAHARWTRVPPGTAASRR